MPISSMNGLQELSRDLHAYRSRPDDKVGYLATRLMIMTMIIVIVIMTQPNPRCGRIPCHIKILIFSKSVRKMTFKIYGTNTNHHQCHQESPKDLYSYASTASCSQYDRVSGDKIDDDDYDD